MQARSSSDGALYTWIAASADFAAAGYPGPGTAQDVAVAMRPTSSGGVGGGSGDVVGPATAVSGRLASYSGTTGKLINDSGVAAADVIKRTGAVPFIADQSMGSHKLTNLANGAAASQDAASVAQVEALIAAAVSTIADWKQSVRAATTGALPTNTRTGNVLTASANGALPSQDGVALVLNDRFLVKDEAAGANRGIYTVTALGSAGAPWSLTRAADADTSAEVTAGLVVAVEEGAVNGPGGSGGGNVFILTTANPVTLNTTALTFSRIGTLSADGTTLTQSGSTLSVATGGVGATQLAANAVTTAKINANAVTGAKLVAGTAAGQELLWDGTAWQLVGRLTGALTDADQTLTFGTAAQYIWPAGTDATAARNKTLSTTGMASAPMAGNGAIFNLIFLRASYANAINVKNNAGATIFTLPSGLGKPLMASFYYDTTTLDWSLAGWEYLGTVMAA